jgi:hypothetical protein
MHDFSTRALPFRRQKRAISIALLTAVTCFAGVAALAASGGPTESALISAPPPNFQKRAAHDIAIEIVKPGSEGLELTARLSEDGGQIARDITWRLRDSSGAIVYDRAVSTAEIKVPPGEYKVEADYGSASFAQSLSVLEANRLYVSFILDVGGIRILPRLKGMGAPAAQPQSLVYSLSGRDKGQLIAISNIAGEVLRVPAGDYRIESRFAAGNAVAVADVKVRAGKLRALEINHMAGLVRLAYTGAARDDVTWMVTNHQGERLPRIEGQSASIVLKPGSYSATASIGDKTMTSYFIIAEGQERDVRLGE